MTKAKVRRMVRGRPEKVDGAHEALQASAQTQAEDGYNDYEDDERAHRITPKGLAWLAMVDAGLLRTREEAGLVFDKFWAEFEAGMREAGYIVDED